MSCAPSFVRNVSFVSNMSLAVAATVGLVVSAGAPAKAQQKTRVTAAVTETIASVNPYADSVSLMYAVYSQTYGSLVDWSFAKGGYVSRFAESWSNPDKLTWAFKLKKGLKRNNGEPVVAADIIHSVNRAMNDPQSKQKHNVRWIKEMSAPDDYTVIFKTSEPVAPMLENLSRIVVTSKAQYDKLGVNADKEAPFGAGPYAIKQIAVDNFFAMTKVPDHPDVKPENPDEVIFRIMKEPESRVTALLNGEVQIAQFIPPQLVPRVQGSSAAHIDWEDAVELMFVAMSPEFPPWDKKEARQAVGYAIDRDALIKVILQGQATRLDGPIGPGQFAYDPNLQPKYEYNPKKARELLAKAGYPNGVEIDFYATVGRYIADKQVCEAIVPMLEAAGFKVNFKTPEWGTLWSNVQKGGVPFYYMGRGSVIDPSAALSQYFETGQSPRIKFSNSQVDAALSAERQEFDETKRIGLLRKAMSIITDEAPAHFLWRHKMATGVANSLDFKPDPTMDIYAVNIKVKPRKAAAK
jgi:peptide/nickel transport system substrate-binding protein